MSGTVQKLITYEKQGETYEVRQYVLVLNTESGEKKMFLDSATYLTLQKGMKIMLLYDNELQDALKIIQVK